MEEKYAVEIGDDVLVWKNGKFDSENKELLDKIKEEIKKAEDSEQLEIYLDGSSLYFGKGVNPEKSWAASFGFIQGLTGGRMKFIAGDRPSWEALGYAQEDNTTY